MVGFCDKPTCIEFVLETHRQAAKIERLSRELAEAQRKADEEASAVGDELHALSKDARRSDAWMKIWHKRARAWEQQLTENGIEPRPALEIDADAEFVP